MDPTVGNPSSRLQYKDVGVNFIELKGRVNLLNRFFVRGTFGFADIGGGRLTDDDFVSGQGAAFYGTATPGAQRISRTFSDIKGDNSWYGVLEAGGRLVNFPHHRGHLDAFIGYRYYFQRHVATGVAQAECTSTAFCDPVGTISHVRDDVISNEQRWQSVELGLDVEYRLLRRLSVYGSGAFLPVNWLNNEDVHYLRTDLRQDPSFRMSGWGIGANLEAGATVAILSQLFLDVGYRFWWNQVLDGQWENFPVGGGGVEVPLREFRSTRQGLTLALRYRF
ncbi:hypothetical protein YTPLAS18_17260 [Nitrospira sp.]|nr:hypothetical protein YTPLAS18_17260 [Nitrospira sp.]